MIFCYTLRPIGPTVDGARSCFRCSSSSMPPQPVSESLASSSDRRPLSALVSPRIPPHLGLGANAAGSTKYSSRESYLDSPEGEEALRNFTATGKPSDRFKRRPCVHFWRNNCLSGRDCNYAHDEFPAATRYRFKPAKKAPPSELKYKHRDCHGSDTVVDLEYVLYCTENWAKHRVLREDSFSKVYRGVDRDERRPQEFTVKRLDRNYPGRAALSSLTAAEIEMLCSVSHDNIIRLLGICINQE